VNKRLLIPLAIIVTLAALFVASPAEASFHSSTISFNASPEPVKAGSYVTLAGKVGYGNSGNTGRISYFFRKRTSSTYSYVATGDVSSAGYYSKKLQQNTSGYWKATYWGNSQRGYVTSSVDYVEAQAYKKVPIVRWSWSGYGESKSSVKSVSTSSALSVYINSSCSDDHIYQSFSWNGYPGFDFDYVYWDGYGAQGTKYLYADVSSGYFNLYAGSDCYTYVKVTQGYTYAWVRV
jgi:hypothetical protein